MEEIICKRCGLHASADEDFCGGCGAFLEWEGERVVVDDGPAPLSAPSASDQKPAPPPPPPSGPVAVQPAPPIERPKPPAPRPPARRAEPGDIFCGQCGQPNNPERRFCRKCGNLLAEQVVAARLPWWKRILRRHKTETAEPRPGESGRGETSGSATTAGTDRQGTEWGFIGGGRHASTARFSSDAEASNSSPRGAAPGHPRQDAGAAFRPHPPAAWEAPYGSSASDRRFRRSSLSQAPGL